MRRAALLAVWLAAAAARADGGSARGAYNRGVDALEAGQLDDAEKQLLDARDRAGSDGELRYRAAFDLGVTLVRRADKAPKEKMDQALLDLRHGADWFRDALRARPGDHDAGINLEVTLRKLQALSDQANAGERGLEARLARAIEDQRTLQDGVRALMARVAGAGSKTEPLAFQGEFQAAATSATTISTDVGVVSDLAGDEAAGIDRKAADQRTPEERGRLVALENLEHYLALARGALGETRLLLRRLQGDAAHRRAGAALEQLKRAQEQLADPVAVLRGVAEDELALRAQSDGLARLSKGEIKLEGGAVAAVPPWLTEAYLGERQGDLRMRTGELIARLKAGVERGGGQVGPMSTAPGAGGATDPELRLVLEAAGRALPPLNAAQAAMGQAGEALARRDVAAAVRAQDEALVDLAAAMEQFADIRGLVELMYAEQAGAVALLDPSQAGAPALTTQQRAQLVQGATSKNRSRSARLGDLLRAKLAELAQPAPAPAAGQQPDPQAEQQRTAETERHQRAEALRGEVEQALARMQAALAGKPPAGEPLASARVALDRIEELRRLFLSIVEHLHELHRQQQETRDQTAGAQAAKDAQRATQVGPLGDAEGRHAARGDQLAQALAAQADRPPAPGDAQGAETQKRLGEAAGAVRAAQAAMAAARALLGEAETTAKTMSVDLTPSLGKQKEALDRLAEAIRILQPPEPQDGDQDKNQDQVSREQAERELQQAREREAARERERRQREQRKPPEPVDKDW